VLTVPPSSLVQPFAYRHPVHVQFLCLSLMPSSLDTPIRVVYESLATSARRYSISARSSCTGRYSSLGTMCLPSISRGVALLLMIHATNSHCGSIRKVGTSAISSGRTTSGGLTSWLYCSPVMPCALRTSIAFTTAGSSYSACISDSFRFISRFPSGVCAGSFPTRFRFRFISRPTVRGMPSRPTCSR
jgi:hypothetical protein